MFFLIKHFLYLSLVDLHCCVNFCSIAKWFSYIYTCVCVCVCVCRHILFYVLLHYSLSQDPEYGSLYRAVGPCSSLLYMIVCIDSQTPPHPPWQRGSLCFTDVFISVTFQSPHISLTMWNLSFSLWGVSLSVIISSCTHVAANGVIFFFFYGWVTFRCIHVPHLLCAFICWCTFRFSPCLGYCEQCCCEHRVGVCIFSSYSFAWIYA